MGLGKVINKKYILLLVFIVVIMCSYACSKDTRNSQVTVIHKDSYVTGNGILYEDSKNINYKSYFDYKSKTNLLFCFDSDCNHTSIECMARQSYSYTFYIGRKLFYIETKKVTYNDNSQAVISYLNKSEIDNPESAVVAEFEGSPVSDIYIKDNILHILVMKPKIIRDKTTSVVYAVYRINMKDYSVSEIPLKKGANENYIPLGLTDNRIILYRRYYDRIINPSDYGFKGDMDDFIKDEQNYIKYMKEVMKVFHEEMYYLDLSSHELTAFDLPIPVLIHEGKYYYNRKTNDGRYSLMSLCLSTNEERMIYDGAAYAVDAVGNRLIIKEGVEEVSEVTFQPVLVYDKDNCREYLYDLDNDEIIEIKNSILNKTDADIRIIAEYEDYYIFFYSSLEEGISQRVGYIRKEDYHNGKDDYVLSEPI